MVQTTMTYSSYTGKQSFYGPQPVMQHSVVGAVSETIQTETRVALTPEVAREFVQNGHQVYVQSNFAIKAGFTNEDYLRVGAKILNTAQEVYNTCNIIMKVNLPQPEEFGLIKQKHIIFSFTELTHEKNVQSMVGSGAVYMSYNYISNGFQTYPVSDSIGELTGFLAVQQAMQLLQRRTLNTMELGSGLGSGMGICFGQTSWQSGSRVLILGATPSGVRAANFAAGAGAQVTLMDSAEALRTVTEKYTTLSNLVSMTVYTTQNLEVMLPVTDVVIGCVLPPFGGRAPTLVSNTQLEMMKPGSVVIDLATRFGGNFEVSHTISQKHKEECYLWNNIYVFTPFDITSFVPKTASMGIAFTALPYVLQVASKGWKKAVLESSGLQRSVIVAEGAVTNWSFKTINTTGTEMFKPVESIIEKEILQALGSEQQQQQLVTLKQQLSTFRSQNNGFWTIEA